MTELSEIDITTAALLTAVLVGIATGCALLALHVALWRQPWRLSAPANYVVGVATLGAGVLALALLLDVPALFLLAALVVVPAGLCIIVAYYVRGALDTLTRSGRRRNALRSLILEEPANGATRRPDATRD